MGLVLIWFGFMGVVSVIVICAMLAPPPPP